MRKILVISICFTHLALAQKQEFEFKLPFQRFDNSFLVGLGMYSLNLMNGNSQVVSQNNQYFSMEFEHLFDMRLYLNVNAYIVTNQSVPNTSGTGMGPNQMPLTQNPNVGGVNVKLGYAFEVITDYLQLIPYGLLGRNTNLAMSTVISNQQRNIINNDYFITFGVGGRIEYKINNVVMLYFDQNALYNMDQSGPIGMVPQNAYNYSTALGAQFAIIRNFQIDAGIIYNKFVLAQSMGATGQSNGGLNPNGDPISPYVPQNSIGWIISAGYSY